MPDNSKYVDTVRTRDGEPVLIRAIRPADKELLQEAFHRLSYRSVYFRFFSSKEELTPKDLVYFTELDFDRHVGLVATLLESGGQHIVGVGRYVVEKDSEPPTAEPAIAVVDQHHGRGIGTLLLEQLMLLARRSGVETFHAEVLGNNNEMMDVFLNSGFEINRKVSSGVVHVVFSTHGKVRPGVRGRG